MDSETLAATLTRGVAALRERRLDDAITALGAVWADPDLEAADDLRDIRARAGSLYTQALVDAGRPRDADGPCRQTIRLLRVLRDKDGLTHVRGLQDRLVAALVEEKAQATRLEEQQTIAATPLDALLAGVTGAVERAEVLVKKANAEHAVGRTETGLELATQALDLARAEGSAHWEVLARLSLVRVDPQAAEAHIAAAADRAAEAEEFNLASMIARAAEVAGVPLPKVVLPR